MNNLSDLGGMVFSTNPDFEWEEDDEITETLAPDKQKLKVYLDIIKKKQKKATVVSGFIGQEDDLKTLAKLIKTKCGVGGSVKDEEIIIQGAYVDKVKAILSDLGYKVK